MFFRAGPEMAFFLFIKSNSCYLSKKEKDGRDKDKFKAQ
jgi:hypothetical protein